MIYFRDYAKKLTSNMLGRIDVSLDSPKIVFVPDLHYKYNDEMRTSVFNIVSSVNEINKRVKLDCLVLGGDNVGNYPEDKQSHIKMMIELKEYLNKLDIPWFCVQGNHDDNSIHCVKSGTTFNTTFTHGNEVSNIEQYNYLFSNQEKFTGFTPGDDKENLCGYYDIENKKTRLVFLNCYDLPDIINGDELVYGRQWCGGYSKNQLLWLMLKVLNDENKEYIFFMHSLLSQNDNCVSDTYIYNQNHFLEMISCFKDGNKTHIYCDNGKYQKFDLDVSFSKSHKVLAFLSGHTHNDNHAYMSNGIVNITTTSAARSVSGEGYDEEGNLLSKVIYTDKETCYDIFCFEKDYIKTYRYGPGKDRTIRYK